MKRVILALAVTAMVLLVAYFVLIVISAANAKTPLPSTQPDLHLRSRQTVSCISCINWKKEFDHDQSIY